MESGRTEKFEARDWYTGAQIGSKSSKLMLVNEHRYERIVFVTFSFCVASFWEFLKGCWNTTAVGLESSLEACHSHKHCNESNLVY
jgi:hypothetical protein